MQMTKNSITHRHPEIVDHLEIILVFFKIIIKVIYLLKHVIL